MAVTYSHVWLTFALATLYKSLTASHLPTDAWTGSRLEVALGHGSHTISVCLLS